MFLKKYENAIISFESCTRMNYNSADSLHFIGIAYRRLGDDAKAAEVFSRAIARGPEKFHSMHNLGEISLKSGQYDEAWQWATRAANIAPQYFAPRALQIALVVFLKKKRSITKLIKSVPSRNQSLLRRDIEEHLKSLGAIKYLAQIDLALKSVYGDTNLKTLTPQQNTQKNRNNVSKQSNKAIKPIAR